LNVSTRGDRCLGNIEQGLCIKQAIKGLIGDEKDILLGGDGASILGLLL
jgi:hypothetical protein